MVIDMLEAVSEMLQDSSDPKIVDCANRMLKKIIEGMKRDESTMFINKDELLGRIKEVKITPSKKMSPKQDQVAIVPNDDGSIRDIIGLDDDEKIELDGKIYTKKEALGKKFQTGKVI